MLIRSAMGETGLLRNIRGSLLLASEVWRPSPLSLIVWPWADHPLYMNRLNFQVKKIILTLQFVVGTKYKIVYACAVYGAFQNVPIGCKDIHTLPWTLQCLYQRLHIRPEDSWLWPRGPGQLWASVTSGKHTLWSLGQVTLHLSMDLLIPRLLKRWSHELLNPSVQKRKGRKKREGGDKKWFSLTCGFFLSASSLWVEFPVNFFFQLKKWCSGWWNIIFRHVEVTADGFVVNTPSPQIMFQG